MPAVQEPQPKSADPRLQVATTVAKQITQVLGVSAGYKAKALNLAVTEAVVKAVPKYMSMATVSAVIAKVQGPPPKVVHTLVPVGTLGAMAAKLPPVTEEVLVQNLVKPLVTPAAGCGQRAAVVPGACD